MKKYFEYSILTLITIPLWIMLGNVIIANEKIINNLWYYVILYLGMLSLIFGIYYLYKNCDFKKYTLKDYIPIILLILFMIWTLITVFHSSYPTLSFIGDSYRREGYFTYLAYAGYIVLGLILSKKNKKEYFYLFVLVGFILSIITINKNYITDLIVGESLDYKSIFHQFNHFGYFLIMALLCNFHLFLNEKSKFVKIILILSFILMTRMLVVNSTFGSYLAVTGAIVISGIYYLFIKPNRLSYFLITIAFVIGSINFNNILDSFIIREMSNHLNQIKSIDYKHLDKVEEQDKINNLGTYRGKLWRCTIELIKEKPIMGYGLDNIGNEMYKRHADNDRPHNVLLQFAVYTGIPGMLLYFSAMFIIIFRIIKKIKIIPLEVLCSLTVSIGWWISSITANTMYYTSPYFMVFIGIILSYLYQNIFKDNM